MPYMRREPMIWARAFMEIHRLCLSVLGKLRGFGIGEVFTLF